MNVFLRLEYDGALFSGWQVQPGEPTVQGALETALATLLNQPVKVVGAGRTDAGVHARNQAANFKAEHLPFSMDKLCRALNGLLGDGVWIKSAREVDDGFSARFSARSRTYLYSITRVKGPLDRHRYFYFPYPMDRAAMESTARLFLGRHDFLNFSVATGEKGTVSDLKKLELRWTESEIFLTFQADRFLHKMVRCLTGTLLCAAQGKLPEDYIRRALEGPVERKLGFCAPPHGLCLMDVEYETGV